MLKSKEELKKMTKKELCDYCRLHKIKGYSGKTKQQRIDLINDYYKSEKQPAKKTLSTVKIHESEKQSKKASTKPKITKQEAFKIRKVILDQLYETLFLTTKDLADILEVSVDEAYKHAKWLENHDFVAGQASAGTGVSTPRGTYRTLSILWEPVYHRESYHDIEFNEVVKKLRKEMNYYEQKPKQPSTKIVGKYSEVSEMDKKKIISLRAYRDGLEKKRGENEIKFETKLAFEKDQVRKKQLRKARNKERGRLTKDIEKTDNKIIRTNLNYYKIINLVRKTFPGRKSESHSTAIRGYRSSSSGYTIEAPSIYNPEISISWNTGGFVSGEKEDIINKRFKDKLKPVLEANGIKFKETSSEIIIEKED